MRTTVVLDRIVSYTVCSKKTDRTKTRTKKKSTTRAKSLTKVGRVEDARGRVHGHILCTVGRLHGLPCGRRQHLHTPGQHPPKHKHIHRYVRVVCVCVFLRYLMSPAQILFILQHISSQKVAANKAADQCHYTLSKPTLVQHYNSSTVHHCDVDTQPHSWPI